MFRKQEQGTEEPVTKGDEIQDFEDEVEMISQFNLPILVFLETTRKFEEVQKGHMVYLMLNWYNKGMTDPLSNVAAQIAIDLKINRPIVIKQVTEDSFRISIPA